MSKSSIPGRPSVEILPGQQNNLVVIKLVNAPKANCQAKPMVCLLPERERKPLPESW